jgi:hypothetical protein
MSDPIMLLVAAIAAAAVLIILNWDTIKAAAQALWDKLGEFVSWLGSVFTSAWQSVASAVNDLEQHQRIISLAGLGKLMTGATT